MNIAEIAKRAGVSSAAVSRYFNDGYISEEKGKKSAGWWKKPDTALRCRRRRSGRKKQK